MWRAILWFMLRIDGQFLAHELSRQRHLEKHFVGRDISETALKKFGKSKHQHVANFPNVISSSFL